MGQAEEQLEAGGAPETLRSGSASARLESVRAKGQGHGSRAGGPDGGSRADAPDGPDGGSRTDGPSDGLAALRLLLRFVRPYRGLAAATLTALVFDMAGMLYVPTELSAMINAAVGAADAGSTAPEIWRHGLAMLVAALCGSGGAIAAAALASRLAANVGRDIRKAVYRASLSLSESQFREFGAGSMITRTLSDANVIQQTLVMGILMILPVPIMCAIAIGLAFSIDGWMGWVLLGVTLAVVLVTVVAVRASAPIFIRLQGYVDRMNTRLREGITGVRVIRAFGKERLARERLDETFDEYAQNAIRVNTMFATADSTTFFLMNAVESLILWLGANRVGAYAMQIGSITALIEYAMLIMFFMMMAQFALLSVPRAIACLGRAGEVLTAGDAGGDEALAETGASPKAAVDAHKAMEVDGGDRSLATAAKTGGAVAAGTEVARFDRVRFRFHDADEDTLRNLDLALERGSVTGVIGPTGSGKSTVAKLLLRFHDVSAGSVHFGGVDVRELARADLRSRIAYVPQKAWLFSGTIAENLRFGDPDATDERLWHALEVAQAGFVRELPDGLESRVAQGGSNFSGGQRQRLAIARALARRADLYIFDDSFSALDYKTDAALRHALRRELGDAAVLIIAQRIATIRDAGQIAVLSDGDMVGLGAHDELVRACPAYRSIVASQEGREANHG